MSRAHQRKRLMLFLGLLISISLTFFACAGSQMIGSPGSASPSTTVVQNENAPKYYDFTDVLIPGKLKLDDKSTYVVQTSGFSTGILVLGGKINRNALVSFFQNNMAKDNWKAISSFKSPRTSTFLLFQKANRWCIISIKEGDFNTHVEIGVAPSSQQDTSGLFK